MIQKKLFLNELFSGWKNSNPDAGMTLFLQEPSGEIDGGRKYPCVIVCPGGGYRFTSDREAEPVALRYAAMGYSAAVLRYSTGGVKFPIQLCELSLAVAFLRRREEFHVEPQKIAVCGFSAGGHLAGSLCNLWNLPLLRDLLPLKEGENKPDAAILSYPVISSGKYAHKGSFANLLGEGTPEPVKALLSLENSVNEKNPPCFLWHTAEDGSVPVENSLLYAMALRDKRVRMELHIYPEGPHGLSLAEYSTTNIDKLKSRSAAMWFPQSVRFLDEVFGVPRYE